MNIHFYLNNEEETMITSFYELTSNPFKVGDEIGLSVDDLYPVEYNKYVEEIQTRIIDGNKELANKFNRTKVKIVRGGKYVSFKTNKEPNLTIEYHCEYLVK